MTNYLDDGTYEATATGFDFAAPTGKTPYVKVSFKITDGGKAIDWLGFLNEKNEARTVEALMACGWSGADFQNLPGLGSKSVFLVVENETQEWEGKERTRARVKFVNSADRVAGVKAEDKMSDAERKGFAARLEALAKGAAPAAAASTDKKAAPF